MYIIYEVYYDIEKHWKLVDDVCFTSYDKAEKYLLNGVKNYEKTDNNMYEIGNTTYFIDKINVIS